MLVVSKAPQTPEIATSGSPAMIEFRCNRCWHSNIAACDISGNMIECRNCGNETTVPEATPDRIARAEALLQEAIPGENPYKPTHFNQELSDAQLIDLARKESYVPLKDMNFSQHSVASIWSRLIAQIVDGFLFTMTFVIGIVSLLLLTKQGIIEKNQADLQKALLGCLVLGLPVTFVLFQWIMVSFHGQTIGKKLLQIRIVTMRGELPGFVRGVFLRVWLRVALSFIPLFGVIDLLFGLRTSRRCLHDVLSGTRVVEIE